MIALSKRWAIVSGAVAVAGGVALQATVLHFHDASALTNAVTAWFTPAPPANPAPAKVESAPPAPAPALPRFDVVRVEPDGSTVVAGQGEPGATVALMASGKAIAEATVDTSGHFAFLPPALPPGGTALSLRQSAGGASAESTQSVAVAVPQKGADKGGLVVALTEPGQAARILTAPVPASPTPASPTPALSVPPPASGAKPGVAPALAIRSVELENGNGFFASGVAAPGTKLGIYLNNSHLADVVAGADSSWTVKLRQGLTPGHYSVRADAAGDPGKVAARVEVPFDVPATAAASAAPQAIPSQTTGSQAAASPPAQSAASTPAQPAASTPAQPAASTPANAVVAEVKTTMVREGDNLWDISRSRLGDGARYTRIYAANAAQIRDPNLIYPGQVFVVPSPTN